MQNRIAAGREGKKEESRAESNEFRADWLAVDSFSRSSPLGLPGSEEVKGCSRSFKWVKGKQSWSKKNQGGGRTKSNRKVQNRPSATTSSHAFPISLPFHSCPANTKGLGCHLLLSSFIPQSVNFASSEVQESTIFDDARPILKLRA